MSRPAPVHLPLETAYRRNVILAVEVLDAVTLTRLSQGISVIARGLSGRPTVNAGGLFVWLTEDITRLQALEIDPGVLPYERRQLAAAALQLPLWTVDLPPRRDYPFTPGVAGVSGMLVEARTAPPVRPVPVAGASVQLRWLDDDGVTWRDAPTLSHTDAQGGFAAIARFTPNEVPRVDASGALTVRVRVDREGIVRESADRPLAQGRVESALLAWDELQP